MEIIGSIAVVIYALALIVLGAWRAPLWVPAVFALGGVTIAFLFVPALAKGFARDWYSKQIGGILETFAGIYAIQLIVAAVLFGIGRGIGVIL